MSGSQVALVTVTGPARTVDVAASAEVPVFELIPPLAALVSSGVSSESPTDAARWRLQREGGGDLSATRTLRDAGVVDGEVLRLVGTNGRT